METRKVQTVGSGTYTVSLPKEWAEAEGLGAGDVVSLHAHIDGVLVVETGDGDGEDDWSVTVPVAGDDPARLERTVRAAYAAGSETVTLDAPAGVTGEGRAGLDGVIRNLTGATVADAGDGRVTVRAPLDAEEVSVRQSVRQLRFVALSMHRNATAALCGDEWVDADRDDQADRLYAMVDRHFARGLARLGEVDALGLTRPELFELWATARELERVADHAERVGELARERDDPVTGERATAFRTVAGRAREVVDEAVEAVVRDDGAETGDDGAETGATAADAAHRALDARDGVREAADDLDRRLFEAADTDYRLGRAVDSLRRTAEHGGNVAELALRAAIRRGAPAGTTADERNRDPAASADK